MWFSFKRKKNLVPVCPPDIEVPHSCEVSEGYEGEPGYFVVVTDKGPTEFPSNRYEGEVKHTTYGTIKFIWDGTVAGLLSKAEDVKQIHRDSINPDSKKVYPL